MFILNNLIISFLEFINLLNEIRIGVVSENTLRIMGELMKTQQYTVNPP